MKEFTVYVDDDLHKRLCAEAERTGLKKAEVVRAAIAAAIEGRIVSYKKPQPPRLRARLKAAKGYVKELLAGQRPATTRPGRRWQKCLYLFRAQRGKYHCMQGRKKQTFPKCFHGCKAYYQRGQRNQIVTNRPLSTGKYRTGWKGRNCKKTL
ncbi:MAG: ribbon-helix-helix protein, CopG family [Deltaproteobacteria bacterium]|nr:ribbon-helix-helix protein, CopG family [Deltaproteobacteria bacterium]